MSGFVPPPAPPPPQKSEAQKKADLNAAFVAAQSATIANAFQVLSAIEAKAIQAVGESGNRQAVADIAARERISNAVRIYCAFVSSR